MGKMFFPQYERGRKEGVDLVIGQSILEHMRRIGGVEIDSDCGGQGTCGRDIIRVEEGLESLTMMTPREQHFLDESVLMPGQRLACQARVARDDKNIRVFIRDFGRYTILIDTIKTDTELEPCVAVAHDRVLYHTGEDLGGYHGKLFGLAVDVGTTTLVMQVVDLLTGESIGNPIASKNPQIAYGNDVISRGGYAMQHESGLNELQAVVVDGINKSLGELEKKLHVQEGTITQYIYDAVVVGNSTMRSIICGQDPRTLAVIPFEPPDTRAVTLNAGDIGLNINPQGKMYGPPLIGGHAGADCLADIIATRLYQSDEIEMIIDIGTNGEVVIGNRDKIMTASCAAGGAYEGYQISCGVGAIEGAITKVKIRNGQLNYETLGDKPPKGICGSGVIDLLAELLRNDIMNERARISGPYRITDDVIITQDDIHQLITAKAGLRTDQDLLIKYFGTNLDGVARIYLAGAFGNYMDLQNAMIVGLYPVIDLDKFIRFGNGALAGARDILISKQKRADAERVARMITHTKPNEIEGENFVLMVVENMYFKKDILEKFT